MLTDTQHAQLAQGAAEWGISLSSEMLDRFLRFASLLEEGNRQLNLTRIRPEDYVTLHFLDSLALAAAVPLKQGIRLADVGSGAGFPGIPIALAFPDLRVTLIDGTRKRVDFLQRVIVELGLTQVTAMHSRAEELARDPAHRRHYDLVCARAVASMTKLAGWLLPLTAPGGFAVAYKSSGATDEIEAARPQIASQGGEVERMIDIALPGADIFRKLVVMRATSAGRAPSRRHNSQE